MDLKDIVSVKGKGGLFRVLKKGEVSMIIQPLNDTKKSVLSTSTHGITVLDNISIYLHTKEETSPLKDVLQSMWKNFGDTLNIDINASPKDLHGFIKMILPDYDEKRVYPSDIKKLIKWYPILLHHIPEIIQGNKKTSNSKKTTDGKKKIQERKNINTKKEILHKNKKGIVKKNTAKKVPPSPKIRKPK